MIKKVLSIAGSDSSCGAGIHADLRTFLEYGTLGLSSITCIVTKDPDKNFMHEVFPIEANIIEKQLKTAFGSTKIDALKTGMFATTDSVELASKYIEKYEMKNVEAIIKLLLPKALITTPNLFEAKVLSGMDKIETVEEMKEACTRILELGPKNVIVKAGKGSTLETAIDVFYDGKEFIVLENERIKTKTSSGAGCTFSAAFAAGLAKGWDFAKTSKIAKEFVLAGIKNGIKNNLEYGQLWHGAYNKAEERMNF